MPVRDERVARLVDDVRHAELGVAVDDPPVLGAPRRRAHVDLVVGLVPRHVDLDGPLGAHFVVEVEGLDRADERAALTDVDALELVRRESREADQRRVGHVRLAGEGRRAVHHVCGVVGADSHPAHLAAVGGVGNIQRPRVGNGHKGAGAAPAREEGNLEALTERVRLHHRVRILTAGGREGEATAPGGHRSDREGSAADRGPRVAGADAERLAHEARIGRHPALARRCVRHDHRVDERQSVGKRRRGGAGPSDLCAALLKGGVGRARCVRSYRRGGLAHGRGRRQVEGHWRVSRHSQRHAPAVSAHQDSLARDGVDDARKGATDECEIDQAVAEHDPWWRRAGRGGEVRQG